MEIREEMRGNTLLLVPGGRLDGTTSAAFGDNLSAKLDQNPNVVVSFAELSYISSAGLRVLLMAAKKVRQTGGKLALCELSPSIREVFEISGFLSIMTVCGTIDDALAAVSA